MSTWLFLQVLIKFSQQMDLLQSPDQNVPYFFRMSIPYQGGWGGKR